MGGDRFNTPYSTIDEDESAYDFSEEQTSDYSSCQKNREGIILRHKVENGSENRAEDNFAFDEFEFGEIMGCPNSSTSLTSKVNCKRKQSLYAQVLATYDDELHLQPRIESLKEAKNKILSYTPGSWIDKVGGFSIGDYNVPQTTTLLLIGPKGSGKSSLVNKISLLFERDKFAPERAQISNGSSVGQGTFFLQEYMIPRGSNSFCLYDTRALSDDSNENMNMLKLWLTRGVRHGELVQRASDDANLKSLLKSKVRKSGHLSGRVRVVNFVIMVVNGISVLESMDSDDEGKKQYTEMIAATFSYPFLSFKDDNPVIVVTHGDLLTLPDRARVRVYLGNLLGVPPMTQIFDIPDGNNKATELAIVDLLSHCLDRADRNLPSKADRNCSPKRRFISKINMLLLLACILLLGIGYIIPSLPGRFVQYKTPYHAPSCVSESPHHAPSCVSESPDRALSSVNKPSDHAPSGVNKLSDHPAPSGVDKPTPHSGVNTPPDPAPSGVNTTPDPDPSAVNKPLDPAPSAVNIPAPNSGVNERSNPASSGVSRRAPSCVNKPPDPALSGMNRHAPSGVNKPIGPDTSDVHISWHEIRHVWYYDD